MNFNKKMSEKFNRLFSSYFWSDLKYKISCWFFPKQKWLLDEIPDVWCDKVELIRILLFKCLEHYVEEEQGLQDKIDWTADLKENHVTQEYVDQVMERDGELREVYEYIKFERPKLEQKMNDAYPSLRSNMFDKQENGFYTMNTTQEENAAYEEVNRIEALIDDKDQWALHTIVNHRQILWT